MQTQQAVAPGDSAFQLQQPAMGTCAFPFEHGKKRDCLSFPPRILKTCACGLPQLIIKFYFLGGREEGLPFFNAP